VRPKKRLGQHFLRHRAILERIADAVAPGPGSVVLEIGPGQGTLTEVLLTRGARVVAIEKDPELVPQLRLRFPTLELIEADAQDLDWRATARPAIGESLLIAGNIPYNITSPLIDQALQPPRPTRIVFLVQREVAERVAAPHGGSTYGALSVGVQAVARVEKLFVVPAGAFHPPPKVDSALLRLTPLDNPLVSDRLIPPFRKLVVGLFGFRRKQLLRGLREFTGWPADRITAVLTRAGLEPTDRPEAVPPAGFARLLDCLIDAGWSPG
jgi:16S rRNA (adenine1518-N6/adenine1519-N6)-dimethyltransferase